MLSFSSLVDRIDRVSNLLLEDCGAAPGEHAAVLLPNCLEFLEVALGIANGGLAATMVSAKAAPPDIRFVCEDSGARVLFAHTTLEEIARSAELEDVEIVVVGDERWERRLASASAHRPTVLVEEWDVACIFYTSGTTGVPKGVLVPHRQRVLTCFAKASEFGCFGPDDIALGISPMCFGAGFTFVLGSLFFGGSAVILPRFDPEEVLRRIEDDGITNAFMVPTHFQAIFGLGQATLDRYDTSSFGTIMSNAAPLSQQMKEQIVGHFGEGVLYELYGSTEASIVSALRPADQLRKPASVGLPFPCTLVRILDDDGQEVEPGTVGELYSSSPYLFNGYWRRPEATEAAMRDGWFTAGDLAQMDDEGYLYLVDRKGDKIISGGVNIFPREVEEVLVRHSAVSEAAVYGVPDARWGESVRATVVLRPGASATADELIEFCKSSTSGYKAPKEIDFADALPRNAVGKVLRRELRAPFWAGHDREIA